MFLRLNRCQSSPNISRTVYFAVCTDPPNKTLYTLYTEINLLRCLVYELSNITQINHTELEIIKIQKKGENIKF